MDMIRTLKITILSLASMICFLTLIGLVTIAGAASQTTPTFPQLKGEVVFTIPWGNEWGKLKFVGEGELSEATYEGPEAMLVSPARDIYVYDGIPRRLHKFAADGKFITGGEIGKGVGVEGLTYGPVRTAGAGRPIIVFDQFGYIGILDKLMDKPGPVKSTELARGAIAEGTNVIRVLVGAGGVYVEERGLRDKMPYVRLYDGASYDQRFEVVDLTFAEMYYYGLELDRGIDKLYSPAANQVVVHRIDPAETTVMKKITLTLPELSDKRARWCLLGAAEGPDPNGPALFYFNNHGKPWADDLIHVVSEDGKVIGTAKVAIPDGEDRGRYLKRWNHFLSVHWSGTLYMGIPDKNGFVVVRYKLPGRGG